MSHGIRPTGFKVRIKQERCVSCGKCETACARKNFARKDDGRFDTRDPNNCNGCTKCRDVCPTHAIAIAAEPLRRVEQVEGTTSPPRQSDANPGGDEGRTSELQ